MTSGFLIFDFHPDPTEDIGEYLHVFTDLACDALQISHHDRAISTHHHSREEPPRRSDGTSEKCSESSTRSAHRFGNQWIIWFQTLSLADKPKVIDSLNRRLQIRRSRSEPEH